MSHGRPDPGQTCIHFSGSGARRPAAGSQRHVIGRPLSSDAVGLVSSLADRAIDGRGCTDEGGNVTITVRNHAKERLEAGELALGVGLRQARTVDIAKIMKTAGYDFLWGSPFRRSVRRLHDARYHSVTVTYSNGATGSLLFCALAAATVRFVARSAPCRNVSRPCAKFLPS